MTGELTDIKYGFSEAAFDILASAAGIKELLCYERDDVSELPEVIYKKEFLSMAQRGIIDAEENRILVLKPYSEIYRTIADRNRIIKIHKNDEIFFLYFTVRSDVVEAEQGRKKGEYIILEFISKQEIRDKLLGMLPDNIIPEDIIFMKPDSDKDAELSVIWEADIYDKDNKEICYFKIVTDGIYLYVHDKEGSVLYRKEEFADRLLQSIASA